MSSARYCELERYQIFSERLSSILAALQNELQQTQAQCEEQKEELQGLMAKNKSLKDDLERAKKERDDAVCEKYTLINNPKNHSVYLSVYETHNNLEQQLAESKLKQAELASQQDNLSYEIKQQAGQIELYDNEIYNLNREHEKVSKQCMIARRKFTETQQAKAKVAEKSGGFSARGFISKMFSRS